MGVEFSTYAFSELLANIVDNRGRTCPTADDGLPLIATNCVKNDTLYPTFEKVRYVDQETAESWFRGHPEPGDIIFVCKGAPGSVCWTPDPVNFCIAQDMVAIRANTSVVDPKFLFALLRYQGTQRQILNMHVGTMIPHFKKGDFKNLDLDIPTDVRIQTAIGEIYFEFCRKIDLNRRMNSTLESMARALFKSWFVDFDPVLDNALAAGNPIPQPLAARAETRRALGPQRKPLPENIRQLFPASFTFHEQMGWIPEGWEAGLFKDIAIHVRDNVRADELHEHGLYVGLEHIGRKELFLADGQTTDAISSNKSAFQKYDVLFGKLRPYFHKVCIAPNSGICSTDILVFRSREEHLTSFMTMLAYSDRFVEYADLHSTGTRMPRASAKDMLNVDVVVPPMRIAHEFDNLAKPHWEKGIDNVAASETAAKLRDTLLPKLLSGELRIPDAEKLVADNV